MKKITVQILCVCTLLFTFPSFSKGEEGKDEVVTQKSSNNYAHMVEMVARVLEIKDMDRSTLSESERDALKQELRLIKTEVNGSTKAEKAMYNNGGIYISVGALIIIILLLILIL